MAGREVLKARQEPCLTTVTYVRRASACGAQLPAGHEELQVDGAAHRLVPGVIRVQVVSGIVLRTELGRMRRVAYGRVEVDHGASLVRIHSLSAWRFASPSGVQ